MLAVSIPGDFTPRMLEMKLRLAASRVVYV